MGKEHDLRSQQPRPRQMGLFVIVSAIAILLITSGYLLASDAVEKRTDDSQIILKKEALIQNYNNLKGKYLQQRDLSDCLLKPLIGSSDWRNNLNFEEQKEKFKPAFCTIFPKSLPHIPVSVFDWSWNRIDTAQYQGWSVYHMGWEWLTPPDEYGFGAFNVGLQNVPEHDNPEQSGKLELAFASWDNPEPYISFSLEHEYAMLMRFWWYHPGQKQFKLAGIGILLEWDEAPGGGINTWMRILSLKGQECSAYVEGEFSPMPHLREEIGSWTMAVLEMAWRKDFNMSSYEPQWKVSKSKRRITSSNRDPGNTKIFSDKELQKMTIKDLQNAYDALWQKYQGAKINADYALYYFSDKPQSVCDECSEIYKKKFIPQD